MQCGRAIPGATPTSAPDVTKVQFGSSRLHSLGAIEIGSLCGAAPPSRRALRAPRVRHPDSRWVVAGLRRDEGGLRTTCHFRSQQSSHPERGAEAPRHRGVNQALGGPHLDAFDLVAATSSRQLGRRRVRGAAEPRDSHVTPRRCTASGDLVSMRPIVIAGRAVLSKLDSHRAATTARSERCASAAAGRQPRVSSRTAGVCRQVAANGTPCEHCVTLGIDG